MARVYLKTEEALEDLVGALRKFQEKKTDLASTLGRESQRVRDWIDEVVRDRRYVCRKASEQLQDAEAELRRCESDDDRDHHRDCTACRDRVGTLRFRLNDAEERLRQAQQESNT